MCVSLQFSWNQLSATYLVEVDAHALELKLRGAVVDTIAVKAMLARDGLPESSTNLVTLINIISTPHI